MHTQKSFLDTPNFSPKFYGISALVAALILSGFWLVTRFADLDYARDMQTWQEKLNLIAESRSATVGGWLSGHFKELRGLADNPSLQLYLTELQVISPPARGQKNSDGSDNDPPQKAYLRTLLVFTAEHEGYSSANVTPSINANIATENKGGLAVVNNRNDIVVSTPMLPETKTFLLEKAAQVEAGKEKFIDIGKDADGTLTLGFIVPIYSIQGEHTPASQIGKIVGIQTVNSNLYALLKHPGITEKTLETILIRQDGDKIEYLSPLQDGSAALAKKTANDPIKVESKLLQNQGGFTSDLKDYRDKTVLATSRAIAHTPWTLVVKIDKGEALADSGQKRAGMVWFFVLIIAVVVLIIIAIWWYAHSKRAMFMSHYFRRMAAKAQAQEYLLRLVADNQPEPIYILDRNATYWFANQRTASEAGMALDSVVGKKLADVRGPIRAEQIVGQCDLALQQGLANFDIQRIIDEGEEKIIRSAYIPLGHIPIATLPDHTPGVLVVEQDISEVIHEREERLDALRQLVQTLVKLVDKRDPFSANHSLLVAEVSHEMATQIELDNVMVEATRMAASLMNIGKIVIPAELLTAHGNLTNEQKQAIRDSMLLAADMLQGVHFDGPVVETLRQWQEYWDGSGPLGLKGEQILITARIIAVANAFVGMISPRSWRDAMTIGAASSQLLNGSDKQFDRRIVIALINYLENHSGRAWLKQLIESQKPASH